MKSKVQTFSEAYDTYYRVVVRFFLARRLDFSESQDLAQETFLSVYKGLDSFKGSPSSMGSWIRTIAQNHLRMFYRNNRSQKRDAEVWSLDSHLDQSGDLAESEFNLVSSAPDSLSIALDKERLALLRRGLESLPEQMQETVRMYLMGLKYREIAQAQAVSINTVKSSLFQAKKKLYEQFVEHDATD